jgi:hypothetical protein
MPPLSEQSERNRLGTMWVKEEFQGKQHLGLGLLYEDFECAKDAYNVLRSWNFGRFIDDVGNIHVSVIAEGDHRYSMLICPGHRYEAEEYIKASVVAKRPQNTHAVVSRLLYYTTTCADYSDRPEVEEAIQSLRRLSTLLLNTYFCDGNEIKQFSKRFFRLKRFRFVERLRLTSRDLEFHLQWGDGRARQPEKTRRTDELVQFILIL